jgi:uncharacterized membrane protein HdeD (DUF308 family)
MAYGLLVSAVGTLALLNPLATGVATGLVLAVGLTFYGFVTLAIALWFMVGAARWTELMLGLAALVAAAYLFARPLVGALSLVWVIGLWLVVSGAFHIVSALRLPVHRLWRLASGALDVVLGLFLLLDGPGAGLFLLSMLVGISFLSRGIMLVSAALAIRRL